MIILGALEDNAILYSYYLLFKNGLSMDLFQYGVYKDIFSFFINPFVSYQPLNFYIPFYLRFFPPYSLSIVYAVINSITGFYLLKRNVVRSYLAFLILPFILSSYFFTHTFNHLELSFYPFIFIVFLILSREHQPIRNLVFVIVMSFLMSLYIGFFLLLFTTSFVVVKFLFFKVRKDLRNFAILFTFLLLTSFVGRLLITKLDPSAIRSYSDFFSFSSRPWYFFIPPLKNPWLADYAQRGLDLVKSTGNFLADDYFAGEHQVNFFGLLFWLTFLFTTYLYLKNQKDTELKKLHLVWLCTSLLLISFMMPPYFTISGFKLYTPGLLVYTFFPMFRATARFSLILHLIMILMLAKNIDFLTTISSRFTNFFKFYVPFLIIITLFETFIPIKIQKLNPPEVYEYMSTNTPENSHFAVYPYSKNNDALLYLYVHQRLLMNPRGYSSENFNSEKFTKMLSTKEGVAAFIERSGDYIVLFKEVDDVEENFFKSIFHIEKEFGDAYLLKRL